MAGHASPVPSRGAAGWPRSLVSACEMPCRTPTAHLFESIARYRLPILRRVVAASPEISSRRIDQSSLPLRPRVRGARVAMAPGGYAKPMTIIENFPEIRTPADVPAALASLASARHVARCLGPAQAGATAVGDPSHASRTVNTVKYGARTRSTYAPAIAGHRALSAQDALGSGWMAAYHPDDIGKHQETRLASLVSG
jgi:hypothetical protein